MNTQTDFYRIYEYVKDSNGKLIGCLYAFKDRAEEDKVLFGWSKYAKNKESKPFSKRAALFLAIDRATTSRVYKKDNLPFAIRVNMEDFSDRCSRYFKQPISNYVEE